MHEGTPEPSAQTPSGMPSRKRSAGATSTVVWIENPPSDLRPVKEIPWIDKCVYGFFSQVEAMNNISIWSNTNIRIFDVEL